MKPLTKRALTLLLSIILIVSSATVAFAANTDGLTYTGTLDKSTLTVSNTDQTVVFSIDANKAVDMCTIGYTINYDSPLVPTAISSTDFTMTAGDYNIEAGSGTDSVTWMPGDMEDVSGIKNYGKITFKVPANTPAGDYEVGISDLVTAADYGMTPIEDGAAVTATLHIQEPAPSGYSVELPTGFDGASSVAVNADYTFTAKDKNNDYEFSATMGKGSATVIDNKDGTYTVKNVSGDLTITLTKTTPKTFTVAITGETAGNDGTSATYKTDYHFTLKEDVAAGLEDGCTYTLKSVTIGGKAYTGYTTSGRTYTIPGTAITGNIAITVEKTTIGASEFTVSLPEGFEGAAKVSSGANYTFTAKDKNNDYEFSATMGKDSATVKDNKNGTYTVAKVTGNLTITLTKTTPKTFTVAITGETADNDGTSATYKTDYHFTLKEDVAAGLEAGCTYTLKSVTIGGKAYTGYTTSGRTYTIPGTAITGNIAITVEKTTIGATKFTVTITGNAKEDAATVSPVNKNDNAVLTLTPVEGFEYTVTAKMGGRTVKVTQSENTYTVSNVTGSVVFTVSRQVPHVHEWNSEYTIDEEPTCTEDGMKSIHCKLCNEVKDVIIIPAIGHDFGDWEKATEATCTEAGTEKRTCANCGETETRTTAAGGHVWNTTYTTDRAATCTTDGSKSIHCQNCGATKDVTAIPAKGHTWDEGKVTKEATAREDGEKVYTCTTCGETRTEVIPATEVPHMGTNDTAGWLVLLTLIPVMSGAIILILRKRSSVR